MPDTAVNRRKGTTGQHAVFTGLLAETTYDTDKKTAVVHDGATPGGFPLAAQHLAQTWVPSQVFANTENFFGNVAAGAPVVKFLSTPGAGFSTLDFNANGTPDLNFIRKYNSTPFQLEIGGSGGIDVVTDTNSNETSADIRFLTNGIRGSGTQTLLATFRDNGMVDLTGRTTIVPKVNTEALRVTTFSLTGAASNVMVELSGTLNTTGSPTLIKLDMGVVAFGASTKLIDLQLASVSKFSVDAAGATSIQGALNLNTNLINNVVNPVAAQDAATKNYVDTAVAGAGSPPFIDSTALVKGSADATKLMRFEVDGFTTATTRVLTVPNADITLATTASSQDFTGTQVFLDGLLIGGGATVLNTDGSASFAGGGAAVDISAAGQLSWGGGTSSLETDGSILINAGLLFSADVTAGSIGFFGALAVQQAVADLTNNATGGTADTIATLGQSLYATDAADIEGNFNQLATKINEILAAIKTYGLFTP